MPHGNKAVARQDAASELVDVHLRQRLIRLVMQFVRLDPILLELLLVLRHGRIYRHLMIRRDTVGLLFEIRPPIHEYVWHLTSAPIQFCCRRTRLDEIDLLVRCDRLKELLGQIDAILRVDRLDAHSQGSEASLCVVTFWRYPIHAALIKYTIIEWQSISLLIDIPIASLDIAGAASC